MVRDQVMKYIQFNKLRFLVYLIHVNSPYGTCEHVQPME